MFHHILVESVRTRLNLIADHAVSIVRTCSKHKHSSYVLTDGVRRSSVIIHRNETREQARELGYMKAEVRSNATWGCSHSSSRLEA